MLSPSSVPTSGTGWMIGGSGSVSYGKQFGAFSGCLFGSSAVGFEGTTSADVAVSKDFVFSSVGVCSYLFVDKWECGGTFVRATLVFWGFAAGEGKLKGALGRRSRYVRGELSAN